jgi:hypothetical protein
MPPEPSELRAIAETALRALNTGDLEGVRWELLELTESGGTGVAKLRATASLGAGSVEQLVWQAATHRDGRLTWWAFFRSEAEARAAAELR